MFIKCLTIVLYIISLFLLVHFSFEYSLKALGEGKDINFLLIMMAIVLMVVLIVIAAMNLFNTINVWRQMVNDKKKSDLDQIIE